MKLAAVAFAVGALAVGVPAVENAGAHGRASTPLPVASASLTQAAQDLVWKVELGSQFSPASLKQQRRSLCLLVERVRNTSVSGVLCVDQGRRKPAARLPTRHPSRTRSAQPISASISRDGGSGITVRFDPNDIGNSYTSLRWQVLSHVPLSRNIEGLQGGVSREAGARQAPRACRWLAAWRVGHRSSYGGSTKVHDIALTFDDGPWDTPPASAFLNVLEREHAVGTFFEIGEHIAPYDPGGTFERRMLADGDMIGDHSWSHPMWPRCRSAEQRFQLVQTIDAIRKATGGFTPCLWRPPYGDISPELVSLARSLGLVTVMWDVDPRDWSLPGVSAIYDNVVDNARNGAIVIQHFGGGPRYETVAALPREIETLRARGYRFVTVAQMLGLRLIYK